MKAAELAALLLEYPDADVRVQMGEDNENACMVGIPAFAPDSNAIVLCVNEGDLLFLPEQYLVEL